MEWVRLFFEGVRLLVDFLVGISWPLAILILFFVFRTQISSLFQRVRKVGSGAAVFEFFEHELHKKAVKKLQITQVTEENFTWDNYLDALERWALWLVMFHGFYVNFYVRGLIPQKEMRDVIKLLKLQYEMLLKKIKQERPKSEMGLLGLKFARQFDERLTQHEKWKAERIAFSKALERYKPPVEGDT